MQEVLMNKEFSRREFLNAAIAASIPGITAPQDGIKKPAPGPNDKIGVAFIGVGGQGTANLNDFRRNPLCRVVAVCDVYGPHRDKALKSLGEGVVASTDYRHILDRKDVDAVVISTPDHWHAIPAIEACRAGKDVYVEKPVARTVAEGEAILRAARKYNRVVQVGTQQRSGKHFQDVVQYVRSGKLGKVDRVDTWILGGTRDLGHPADAPPPPDLDWDLWLGPARKRPFNPAICPYNFRWFWDYAGGQMSNWGVHLLDIARWAMNVSLPERIEAVGGILSTQDCRETPDTLDVAYTYPNGLTMTFWHRVGNALPPDGNPKHEIGIWFHGSNGDLFVDRNGWNVSPRGSSTPSEQHGGSDQHPSHVQNFLECVKSRKRPNSDIAIGQTSTTLCHLGNIAYVVGQPLSWDAGSKRFIDNDVANALLRPVYRAPWKLG
jgi:predicted dehydrogenase